jgi:hypothetical protein
MPRPPSSTHPNPHPPTPTPPRQSEVSLASSEGDPSGARDEPVLDSGIKLPEGAELFAAEVVLLHPTQLAVGMQQARRLGAGAL